MKKFARIDTATGKGINEGYCVQDGEAYFENEQDLILYLRNEMNVDDNNKLSDEFILKEAYENDEYYYTEWDVDSEEYWYEEEDGVLVEKIVKLTNMKITINIVEVASELADKDLIIAFAGEGGKSRFPNGIVRDVETEDDMTEYTDEAQDFFNERYDYWWDYLYDQKVGSDE